MHYQCTYCDISAKSIDDPKFDGCRPKKHQIVRMLDQKEINDSIKEAKTKPKLQRKKVKGFIGELYVESILLESKPSFLCVTLNSNVSTKDSVETEDVIIKPLDAEQCGYFPYNFTNSDLDNVNNPISKEELFNEIKTEINRYVSVRDLDSLLILGDIFLTYCQEWISTIHYPFFVGETESGKSTVLHLAKWLCYRCHLGEDVPMADVYNFLGTDEEGTGTIAEDEAQELWKNREKIRMYKSSYAKGSLKARIVGADSLGKHQVFYKTFCPKWFAGERVPQDKGFLERIPVVHMTEGQPIGNIKRVSKEEADQLNRLRNRLLVWKLQNINKGLDKTQTDLKQRDQELWEDFLRVAHGTKYEERFRNVVTYYVDQRHETIRNSLEAKLMKLVLDKLDVDLELKFEEFWNYLTIENSEFPGKLDDRSGKTFFSDDYAEKITFQLISKIFDNKFQAVRHHKIIREDEKQHKITLYSFKREVLEKLIPKYRIELPINSPFYVGQHGQQGHVEPQADTQVDQVNQDNKGGMVLSTQEQNLSNNEAKNG